MSFLIYLDVCCFNRPFDEQLQERVRLESEAILLILARCQRAEWRLLGSEAVTAEIAQTSNRERRSRITTLASLATTIVMVDDTLEVRAAELIQQGFTVFDALHLACAVAGNADVFLTTDDRLLRRAARLANMIELRVANPVQWLLEVMTDATE